MMSWEKGMLNWNLPTQNSSSNKEYRMMALDTGRTLKRSRTSEQDLFISCKKEQKKIDEKYIEAVKKGINL